MYGLLTHDLARTVQEDREREISHLAMERAAADASASSIHQRLMAVARRVRGLNPSGRVQTAIPSVGH